jgi:hypothetical protein
MRGDPRRVDERENGVIDGRVILLTIKIPSACYSVSALRDVSRIGKELA